MSIHKGTKDIEENTSTGGGGDYFMLPEPKRGEKFTETEIRFLVKEADDIEGCTVHKLKIVGKNGERNINVNCIGKENDCPLCKTGRKPVMRVFMQVHDLTDDTVKVWERTGKFYSIDILPALMKVKGAEVVGGIFNIKRYGGGLDTVYKVDYIEEDKTTLSKDYKDLEPLEILGHFVYDKTAEEMQHWLDTEVDGVGEFPATAENQQGKRRTGGSSRAVSAKTKPEEPSNNEGSDNGEESSEEPTQEESPRAQARRRVNTVTPVGRKRRFQ